MFTKPLMAVPRVPVLSPSSPLRTPVPLFSNSMDTIGKVACSRFAKIASLVPLLEVDLEVVVEEVSLELAEVSVVGLAVAVVDSLPEAALEEVSVEVVVVVLAVVLEAHQLPLLATTQEECPTLLMTSRTMPLPVANHRRSSMFEIFRGPPATRTW